MKAWPHHCLDQPPWHRQHCALDGRVAEALPVHHIRAGCPHIHAVHRAVGAWCQSRRRLEVEMQPASARPLSVGPQVGLMLQCPFNPCGINIEHIERFPAEDAPQAARKFEFPSFKLRAVARCSLFPSRDQRSLVLIARQQSEIWGKHDSMVSKIVKESYAPIRRLALRRCPVLIKLGLSEPAALRIYPEDV